MEKSDLDKLVAGSTVFTADGDAQIHFLVAKSDDERQILVRDRLGNESWQDVSGFVFNPRPPMLQCLSGNEPDLGCCLLHNSREPVLIWGEKTPTKAEIAEAKTRAEELMAVERLSSPEGGWSKRRQIAVLTRYLLAGIASGALPAPPEGSRQAADLARLAAMVGADQDEAGGGKLGLGVVERKV